MEFRACVILLHSMITAILIDGRFGTSFCVRGAVVIAPLCSRHTACKKHRFCASASASFTKATYAASALPST